MQDNLRFIQKQIEKNRIEAEAARRQAQAERNQAGRYTEPDQQSNKGIHDAQALRFEEKANRLEDEADALEPKKVEIESRINELKTERDAINRQTLDRTVEIDKELAQIQ